MTVNKCSYRASLYRRGHLKNPDKKPKQNFGASHQALAGAPTNVKNQEWSTVTHHPAPPLLSPYPSPQSLARNMTHPSDRLTGDLDAVCHQVSHRRAQPAGKAQAPEALPHLGHLGSLVALLGDQGRALVLRIKQTPSVQRARVSAAQII